MTPAERLLKAADLLDARAAAATPGPWVLWPGPDKSLVCTTVDHCTCGGGLEGYGHEPGCGLEEPPGIQAANAEASYVATMHPGVGKAVAKALRGDAKRIVDSTLAQPFYKGNAALVAIADLILAGESQ